MPLEYPLPPTDSPDSRKLLRQVSETVRRIMNGKTNNVVEFTLTANQGTTTLTDARFTLCTALIATPLTANAAAEQANGTMYVLDTGRVNGAITITHANNAQTDRTFRAVFVG